MPGFVVEDRIFTFNGGKSSVGKEIFVHLPNGIYPPPPLFKLSQLFYPLILLKF